METTIIRIGGMSCGGCVKSISGRLAALPGVSRAEVSLEQAQVMVEFDPLLIGLEQVVDTIETAGFKAAK